jgi:hypothetical protein
LRSTFSGLPSCALPTGMPSLDRASAFKATARFAHTPRS